MKQRNFGVPAVVTEYNSNNSWGFGGASGLRYEFAENLVCLIAHASTRHLGTFPFITVTYNGKRVLDISGHTKKTVNKAKELVHVCLILNLLNE